LSGLLLIPLEVDKQMVSFEVVGFSQSLEVKIVKHFISYKRKTLWLS